MIPSADTRNGMSPGLEKPSLVVIPHCKYTKLVKELAIRKLLITNRLVTGQFLDLLCILRRGQGLTVRELIAEQRRRLGSVHPVERLAAALNVPAVLAKQLANLADRQIGQLLLDEVWPRLNLLRPESTICLHAADRLRSLKAGEGVECLACPRCGNNAYFHCGIEEPDYWQCDLVSCGHKWQPPRQTISRY